MQNMANRKFIGSSSRMQNYKFSKEVHLNIFGEPFILERKVLSQKSAKLAELLKENPQEDVSHLLRDIPSDPKTFELVARFCYGLEVSISTENVIRVCCVAHYLGMTETHSPNNLFEKTISFLEQDVFPCWNKSLRALKTTEHIFQPAVHLGLVGLLAESIITKVSDNPRLLGEPIKILTSDDDGEENEHVYRPNARRNLFDLDWHSEDLTTLSLQLYEPIIRAMIQRQIPSEYIAASLCQYVRKWVFCESIGLEDTSFEKVNSQRETIEAVERLLPQEIGLLPCTLFFEMLRISITLEASSDCRNGFEVRAGKQLDQATVKDLLIPCFGYAREEQYDTECVRRILKHFYCNSSSPNTSAMIKVAELIEDFLAEIASDIDLKKNTFISLGEMAFSACAAAQRSSDGMYRAISIYLDKHTYLTESEKEDVCRPLDFSKMTPEACDHAAMNKQLPLRVVLQVLFLNQLQLRDTITKEVQSSDDGPVKFKEEITSDEQLRIEMKNMSCKMTELARQCSMMRKEIGGGVCNRQKKEKGGVWKEMKRKFGCTTAMHDHNYNCHVKKKKVHPR